MPLPTSLVVIERFKDVRQMLGWNAGAGILDGQADIFARGGVRNLAGIGFIKRDGGGVHEEPSAFGHGVAGIDGEIQQNLFHHARIGVDQRERRGVIDLEGDVLAQETAEHFGHVD